MYAVLEHGAFCTLGNLPQGLILAPKITFLVPNVLVVRIKKGKDFLEKVVSSIYSTVLKAAGSLSLIWKDIERLIILSHY